MSIFVIEDRYHAWRAAALQALADNLAPETIEWRIEAQASASYEQAVLDYVEALYEADSARIEKSVHRDLFKLGFERDKDGAYKPYRMTYQELYDLAGRWNKTGRIPKNSKKEIVVYDVADQTASAKLTAMWGIDYLHLAKFDGKWMITDILWQTPPH